MSSTPILKTRNQVFFDKTSLFLIKKDVLVHDTPIIALFGEGQMYMALPLQCKKAASVFQEHVIQVIMEQAYHRTKAHPLKSRSKTSNQKHHLWPTLHIYWPSFCPNDTYCHLVICNCISLIQPYIPNTWQELSASNIKLFLVNEKTWTN